MFPIYDENPTKIIPYLTYAFIVICVGVFVWQFSETPEGQQNIIYALGVIPAVVFGEQSLPEHLVWIPAWATMFSSMFLHGGWMHLIGNMLYLWVFGNNIENAMGHVKFFIFYFLCGAAAVLAQALGDFDSVIPMVGASGAISGVLGAYLLLYPQARVTVILPIFIIIKTFKVPAMVVLGVWFLMQLFSSITTMGQDGGVAFGAHVGGFLAGMVLIAFFKDDDVPIRIPFIHFHPWRK